MDMFKVMIRDNMSPIAKERLEAIDSIEVVVDNNKETNSPEALSAIIKDFHAIAIRSGTRITDQVLANAPHLKVIGRAGAGVDNIDVEAATKRGIVVMNAPGGNTVTTAEHAISLMLSLARNIPQGTASLREGRWEKKTLTGIEITGKILGIVGLGQIGRVVAERAGGLKMRVIASDPFVGKSSAREMGVELVTLDELFRLADFITLHVPRLPETAGMINAETIQKMKPGVRIINCSRGEVVDLDALHEAVQTGHVAGAALDVFPKEPPDPSLPILKNPKIIFTPHLGASTGEAQDKVAIMIADQIADYLDKEIITNAVNFPSISKDILIHIAPHLSLSERMGSLMGQLVRTAIHDINITYSGEFTKLDTRLLTHAAIKGLLSSFTDRPVNQINALSLAKEKGITIKETMSQATENFTGLIKIKLEGCESAPDEVWGTIFGEKYPRIVRLGTISMDAIPEGYMAVIRNHDKPGVIGNLGTLLGKHNINIGRFQLGRREGQALCMVNIDTPMNDGILNQIRLLPNIISATQVKLG
ncbi:MAG: phosphoglycerate dehydrogenase [Desulfobacteraceae bacterium]|nr:MAG: phosphoglycerate dehydrogenase [Desulfobacteraceae bacterium]